MENIVGTKGSLTMVTGWSLTMVTGWSLTIEWSLNGQWRVSEN